MKDWVTERSQCSPVLVFERLKDDLKNDIALRNAIIPNGSAYKFRADIGGNSVIVVLDGIPGDNSLGIKLEGKMFVANY
jgi:hypothetical protein